jgi:ABC-type transporter Mla MlaB component
MTTPDLHSSLEAHRDAATLYVAGTLSVAGALDVMRRCDALPNRVRALRVDLRGVRLMDVCALEALAFTLRRWRDARCGITRIALPSPRAAAVAP